MKPNFSMRFPLNGNLLLRKPSTFSRPKQVTTYKQISLSAAKVRSIYAGLNIAINEASYLAKLLRHAETISQEWDDGHKDQNIRSVLNAANTIRLVDAIIAAGTGKVAIESLTRIARSDVDLSRRKISQGKDALWELELVLYLKGKGISVHMQEPDIIAELGRENYPIACKKIYSEKGVEGQMRKGAHQLKPFSGAGLIAFNIDDLVPEDVILRASTVENANEKMHGFIMEFLARHQEKIRRFLMAGRCDGLLVSVSVPVDIENSRPSFNNHNQILIWSLGSASTPQANQRIAAFRMAMEGIVP